MLVALLVILLLILMNGFFAMSELALVSSRRARLRAMAEQGHGGAAVALELLEAPGRFLSTVQVGITLVGILAGAIGGATLSARFAQWLAATAPFLNGAAEEVAFVVLVGGITFFSLIIGELIPKHLALGEPERIAGAVARPMRLLARGAGPVVSLLDATTRWGLRLLGRAEVPQRTVTDEEILTLVKEAKAAGVVEYAEETMITGVMRLADLPVEALMTPRPDIVWLDLDEPREENLKRLRASGHSRLPVSRGELDNLTGVLQVKDVLDAALEGTPLQLEQLARPPNIVPEGVAALRIIEILKRSPIHLVLVVDEYGSIQGVVTATDVLEAVLGAELAELGEEPGLQQRDDGSWLMDGGLSIGRVQDVLSLSSLPEQGDYHTLAGFVLTRLGRLPAVGERLEWAGWCFEVVDMDGNRIDKVLVAPLTPGAQDEPRA